MSIATEARVTALEARVEEIESRLAAASSLELLAHIATLELRIERLEQARKPGPKPKDSNG